MPGFTIRKATRADAEILNEMRLLLQRHSEEVNPTIWRLTPKGEEKMRRDTEEMLKDENGVVLIAERDSTPVGFVYGRHIYREEYEPPNIGQVNLIFVKEPHRKCGAGSLLVAELCRFFTSKGVEDVTLNYIHGNPDAEGFWGSLGLEHRLHIAGTPLEALKRRLRVSQASSEGILTRNKLGTPTNLPELKSSQRSHLKGLAHGLKPTIQIGKNGLTEAVVQTISRALDDHELIKVKFLGHKDEREELSRTLAGKTGSELIAVVGNIAVLYRQASEPEKRTITLPPD